MGEAGIYATHLIAAELGENAAMGDGLVNHRRESCVVETRNPMKAMGLVASR
jgi:hypothetical protein